MRLSNTELRSLLNRSLEGAGWTNGRYEEAAHAVCWLESHGIRWLDGLASVWPRLFLSDVSTPELSYDHIATCVIDAGNSSLLHCGPNSIDLAYANAHSETLVSVETRYCFDRIMILPGLVTMAKRGANAIARWYCDEKLHIASIRANSEFPTYRQYRLKSQLKLKDSSIFLLCSLKTNGLNHFLRSVSKLSGNHDEVSVLSPEYFRQHAATSFNHGIDVSEEAIGILNEAGTRVLVEATEQSRKGAG